MAVSKSMRYTQQKQTVSSVVATQNKIHATNASFRQGDDFIKQKRFFIDPSIIDQPATSRFTVNAQKTLNLVSALRETLRPRKALNTKQNKYIAFVKYCRIYCLLNKLFLHRVAGPSRYFMYFSEHIVVARRYRLYGARGRRGIIPKSFYQYSRVSAEQPYTRILYRIKRMRYFFMRVVLLKKRSKKERFVFARLYANKRIVRFFMKRFATHRKLKRRLLKAISSNFLKTPYQSTPKISGAFFYSHKACSVKRHGSGVSKVYKQTLHDSLFIGYRERVFSTTLAVAATYTMYWRCLRSTNTIQESVSKKQLGVHTDDAINRRPFEQKLEIFGAQAFILNEQRFHQIRFKPGYLPLFRRFRVFFMESRNLKLWRHHKMTKFVARYASISHRSLLKQQAFSLATLLLEVKFCNSMAAAKSLICNGLVQLNGTACFKNNIILQVNDVVNITACYQNYARAFLVYEHIVQTALTLYRYWTTQCVKNLNGGAYWYYDLDSKAARISKASRVSKLTRLGALHRDIPRTCEVDFLTLSFLIIKDITTIGDINSIATRYSSAANLRMLNWKYIN